MMSWSYRLAVLALLGSLLGAVIQLRSLTTASFVLDEESASWSRAASDEPRDEVKLVDMGRTDFLRSFEPGGAMPIEQVLGLLPGDTIDSIGSSSFHGVPPLMIRESLRQLGANRDFLDLIVARQAQPLRILLVLHD